MDILSLDGFQISPYRLQRRRDRSYTRKNLLIIEVYGNETSDLVL